MSRRTQTPKIALRVGIVVLVVFVTICLDRGYLQLLYKLELLMHAGYGLLELILVPLSIMFVPVGLTTYWFWWVNNRPEGKCLNCGYDLTGNVSGVCPECGTPID